MSSFTGAAVRAGWPLVEYADNNRSLCPERSLRSRQKQATFYFFERPQDAFTRTTNFLCTTKIP